MKKALLLALMTITATATFAQQQLATLNHRDSISVYYGFSALEQAHAAAVAGDIITLSPGSFDYDGRITKAVTIRGAGMQRDSLGNEPTVINSGYSYWGYGRALTVDVPYDSIHFPIIEGIYFDGDVSLDQAHSLRIIKCFVSLSLCPHSGSHNTLIINCILKQSNTCYTTTTTDNISFVNSIILGDRPKITAGANYINCVAVMDQTLNTLPNQYVMNSIFIEPSGLSLARYYGYNSATCYYSIGIAREGNFYFDTTLPDHHLINSHSYNSVFKTFNGRYTEGETFELQDSIAATILGNDGTQVGIYGGQFPFNPNVRNPRIKRCTVAQRSTADNKLAVDIEVVSE